MIMGHPMYNFKVCVLEGEVKAEFVAKANTACSHTALWKHKSYDHTYVPYLWIQEPEKVYGKETWEIPRHDSQGVYNAPGTAQQVPTFFRGFRSEGRRKTRSRRNQGDSVPHNAAFVDEENYRARIQSHCLLSRHISDFLETSSKNLSPTERGSPTRKFIFLNPAMTVPQMTTKKKKPCSALVC